MSRDWTGFVFWHANTTWRVTGRHRQLPDMWDIQAEQGGRSYFRETTLEAVERAQLKGRHWLEEDLREE